MAKGMSRSLDAADEHAEKGGVAIDVVYLGDMKVKRATYPAGWRFSKDMGADRCQDNHIGYVISGSMHAALDDGTQIDMEPGHVFVVPSGHDAWCEDDCTIVQFDEFEGAAARFGLS